MISNDATAADRAEVLVIKDPRRAEGPAEALSEQGEFKVLEAADPKEAIEIFKDGTPDIAIIDAGEAGTEGLQLCRLFKDMAGWRYFPVILLAGSKDVGLRGLESGADDFICRPADVEELLARIRSLLKLKALHDELEHSGNIILTLAATLEARDPCTQGHSMRVGEISREFGDYLGLSLKDQEMLRKAGLLHDIGKIGLSKDLFLKPPPLSVEEMEEIKRHTILGEQICKPLHSLREVLPAIRYHHERWDGKGFPDGLKGEEIPFSARILSIVDSFDAMYAERLYREGRSAFEVLEVMMEEKTLGQWDPFLLEHFIEMMTLTGSGLLEDGTGTGSRVSGVRR